MRPLSTLSGALFVVIASAASAQQPAPSHTPSVAGYLCTFAQKCGPETTAPVETKDAPRTKGFRLARSAPAASAPPTAHLAAAPRGATATSRRSYARETAAGTASAGRGASRYTAPVASYPVAAAGTGTAAGAVPPRPRADLMIGFDYNSARLSSAGMASARIFAQSLLTAELASKRFLIEGHTDLRGGRPLNMDLSQRRAQAVADFLVAQGVNRARLTARGRGPDVPLPGHAVTDPSNRRVEAELSS